MIECRTYTFQPGRLPAYLALIEREGVLDRLLQNMRGYWLGESGVVNTAWHVWQYADRAGRAAARAKLAADPIVSGFMREALPLLRQQHSIFLNGELETAPSGPAGGVFDRVELRRAPGDLASARETLAELGKAIGQRAQIVAALRGSPLEGGHNITHAIFVLRFPSFAERAEQAPGLESALEDAAAGGWHCVGDQQLMLPAKFSPWQ